MKVKKKYLIAGSLVLSVSLIFLAVIHFSANSQRESYYKASLEVINDTAPENFITKTEPLDCYDAGRKFSPSPTYCSVKFSFVPLQANAIQDFSAHLLAQGWQEWYTGIDELYGTKKQTSLFKEIKVDSLLGDGFNCDTTIYFEYGPIEGECRWEHQGINSLFSE